jgi:hypothetical protein
MRLGDEANKAIIRTHARVDGGLQFRRITGGKIFKKVLTRCRFPDETAS